MYDIISDPCLQEAVELGALLALSTPGTVYTAPPIGIFSGSQVQIGISTLGYYFYLKYKKQKQYEAVQQLQTPFKLQSMRVIRR